MIVATESSVGLRDYEYGRRVIAMARSPRKRDFLKVLLGAYEPRLWVYQDPIPAGGIRRTPLRDFGGVITEGEYDFAAMLDPDEPHSSAPMDNAEEYVRELRFTAGLPNPVNA